VAARQNESELELRARLLVEAEQERAQALARDLADEPPLDGVDPTDDEIADAWAYSPEPDPASSFWALVELAQQRGMPLDQAEELALRQVYPHRATLLGLGLFPLEIQIKRAERIQRLVARHAERRRTGRTNGRTADA
jgi:hypothetical protein